MGQTDESGGRYIRPEDIECFLNVFKRVTGEGYARHTSYRSLLGEEKYTTRLNQLGRIAEFADTIDPEGSKRGGRRGLSRGQPLHVLFRRRGEGDGGLQPTEIARALFKVLSPLMDAYGSLGRQVAQRLNLSVDDRKVRGAAAPNFSHHVCPFILSQWKEKGIFGDLLRLTWTIGNTTDLLPKLDAGALDFVLGYGPVDAWGVLVSESSEAVPDMQIAFTSFRYDSKAILACHPSEPLWLTTGHDHNKGYYEFLERCRKNKEKDGEKTPTYEQLREVKLDDLYIGKTKLIITRSWGQPPQLEAFLGEARRNGMSIQYVDAYDEAAAMVRMQLGIAVLPEVYSKRRMLNAFRLAPQKDFTRWIGVYYSTRFPFSQEAYTVVEFLRRYYEDFRDSIRNGHPVGYGDRVRVRIGDRMKEQDFTQWCRDFRIEGDWLAGAREKYRLGGRRKETASGKKRSRD